MNIWCFRVAKRKLDDYEFCGGKLHVCYAPEYETVEDTRAKLDNRRRAVARRIHQLTGKGKFCVVVTFTRMYYDLSCLLVGWFVCSLMCSLVCLLFGIR